MGEMGAKKDTKATSKAPAKAPKKKEGGGGGKAKKKKWSRGKTRDKLNNLVLFDKATYDKLMKVRGSLARKALQELHTKGVIRQVVKHRSQLIYTRVTKEEDGEEEKEAEKKK